MVGSAYEDAMLEHDQSSLVPTDPDSEERRVGYKNPPVHSRFKAGLSGNPSGRAKGSRNLKTLFQKVLKEEVSLRDGERVKKVSKAEAVIRSIVIGALKGDSRCLGMLLRVAECTGEFDDKAEEGKQPTVVVLRTFYDGKQDES
jgi:hypothetical protein